MTKNQNSRCDDIYDLAVIGAGSAGFSAAITAAEEGARVALIGHGTIGGTCVNVGCVPSKTMIRAMEAVHSARAAQRFKGIEASANVSDWSAIIRQKQALVDEMRAAKYTDILASYDRVTYLEGTAGFSQNGLLTLDGRNVAAANIIIATGSRPYVPSIPGLDAVEHYDSTSILELETLPSSLIVMGGGYIGVELAQVFARAGVSVSLVTRRGLLPEAEPEISSALTRHFSEEGIRILNGLKYENVTATDNGIALHAQNQDGKVVIQGEKLLLATGRIPNTDHLNLKPAGIEIDGNGGIRVDAHLRTSRKDVYAAGDVTGRDQFVYMAAYGAKLAAKNAMNGNSLIYDGSVIPAVVFSDPQVATVGLTEAQAAVSGYNLRSTILAMEHVPRAQAARDTRGLFKMVVDRGNGRLLGAHILSPEGADSIQTAAMAIRAGMTYEELGAMIFPYLTNVEGLKLAAQTFDRDVAKLSCCAG